MEKGGDAIDDGVLLFVERGDDAVGGVFKEVEDAGGADDFFCGFDQDARVAEFVDGSDGAEMEGIFEFGFFERKEGEEVGVEIFDGREAIASGGGEFGEWVWEWAGECYGLDGSFAGLLFDGFGNGGGHDEPEGTGVVLGDPLAEFELERGHDNGGGG